MDNMPEARKLDMVLDSYTETTTAAIQSGVIDVTVDWSRASDDVILMGLEDWAMRLYQARLRKLSTSTDSALKAEWKRIQDSRQYTAKIADLAAGMRRRGRKPAPKPVTVEQATAVLAALDPQQLAAIFAQLQKQPA